MPISVNTYAYKNTPHGDIYLDIYQNPSLSKGTPVILWLHGGALIGGSRVGLEGPRTEGFDRWYLSEDFAVIAIDYRLAPETKAPDIIMDIKDAIQWVRTEGANLENIDPDRLGVVGHSAGGYLALMAGTFAPPPQALVSFYGYSDIVGDWLCKPAPFYCQKPRVSEDDAYKLVQGPPVSHRRGDGGFYLYCRQNGLWPQEVGGKDPTLDPLFFKSFCPHLNVSEAYPPTLLLHGDQDTDVPYQQSIVMAEALTQTGIENHLHIIKDAGHGFEGHDDPQEPNVRKTVKEFLREHLKPNE